MQRVNFNDDVKRGNIGEIIFEEDFLSFLGIKFQDVTLSQGYQVIDSDFLAKIGLYEIKTNYKDNKQIIIEEFGNHNTKLGRISPGWMTGCLPAL